MKITVTADDIKNGLRGSACNCPIARAIWKHRHVTKVAVGRIGCTVWYTDAEKGVSYMLPPAAHAFIDLFDVGFRVQPFTFTMRKAKIK